MRVIYLIIRYITLKIEEIETLELSIKTLIIQSENVVNAFFYPTREERLSKAKLLKERHHWFDSK